MRLLEDTSHGMQSAWIGHTGETLQNSITSLTQVLSGIESEALKGFTCAAAGPYANNDDLVCSSGLHMAERLAALFRSKDDLLPPCRDGAVLDKAYGSLAQKKSMPGVDGTLPYLQVGAGHRRGADGAAVGGRHPQGYTRGSYRRTGRYCCGQEDGTGVCGAGEALRMRMRSLAGKLCRRHMSGHKDIFLRMKGSSACKLQSVF